MSTPSPMAGAAIVAGLVLSLVRGILFHAARRSPSAVVALLWARDGDWHLFTRAGLVLRVTLCPGAFSHPSLVALVFVDARGHRRAVVILPDMVDGESMRRLRVDLRCHGAVAFGTGG